MCLCVGVRVCVCVSYVSNLLIGVFGFFATALHDISSEGLPWQRKGAQGRVSVASTGINAEKDQRRGEQGSGEGLGLERVWGCGGCGG